MYQKSFNTLLIFTIVFYYWAICSATTADENWPQFRGKQAAGIAAGNPPTTWDVETKEYILWKSKIAGLGHSSPIVWQDKIFLATAVNEKTDDPSLQTGWLGGTGKSPKDEGDWQWQLICIDLKSGKQQWAKTLAKGKPAIQRHLKATHANCTPATDGKRVVAFFGSEGLYCLDLGGNLLWEKNFGKLHSGPYNSKKLEWGFASSPIIHDDKVIVQCDCLNTGFVSILDIKNGKEIRRIERKDVATWSTPTVIEADGKTQIVCNGYKQMASYDLETGEQLWTLKGGGDVPVPTPLFSNGIIFLTNGHGRSPTYAISPTARGTITPRKDSEDLPEGLKWYQPKGGSYMPTPIIVGKYLYNCNDNGVLTVRDAKTGEQIYKQRVSKTSGTYSASAVATKDRIYFCNEKGIVDVIKTGPEYELISSNDMQEIIMATPAIAGNYLLIRTSKNLYCIGKRD